MSAVMNDIRNGTYTQPNTLEQTLQALLQQSQQTNLMLGNLAGELRAMNEQLFHRQGATPVPMNNTPLPPLAGEGPGERAEAWQRQTDQGKCAEVGITKTRSLNKWKVNFYMYGLNKPASFYARDGYEQVLRFLGEVWPDINADLFSEERFNERNKAARDSNPDRVHEDRYTLPPFIVEFSDSPPRQMENGMRVSFRYANRVSVIGG